MFKSNSEKMIASLEADIDRLKRLKANAVKRKEREKLGEFEREELLKKTALKQAQLRKEAVLREADLQQKMESETRKMEEEVMKSLEQARKSAEKRKQREKEHEERLAYLKLKALEMRQELGSPNVSLGLTDALAEIKRLDKLMNSDRKTHPVKTKKPNGLGLYDMSVNVWEWVEDVYSSEAYSKHQRNNSIYTGSGSYRVYRGGSWG